MKIVARLIAAISLVALAVCAAQAGAERPGPDASKIFDTPHGVELAAAIAAGDASRIRDLVRSGARLSETGKDGVTLLQWAMLRDQPRVLKLLLDLGADPLQDGYRGQTALHMAAMAKQKAYLKILLENGASPDVRDSRTEAPVLAEALMSGNRAGVALLLAHGADPDLADRMGNTPLHVAAKINDYDSMLVLLKAGADPTLRNTSDKSFAAYFAIHPKESIMSGEAKAARIAIQDWLVRNGYPRDGGAG